MILSFNLIISEITEGFWAREWKRNRTYIFKRFPRKCIENGWQWGKNGSRKTSKEARTPVQTRDDGPQIWVRQVEIKGSEWIWSRIAKRLDVGDQRRGESKDATFLAWAVHCHLLRWGRLENREGSQGLYFGCTTFDKTIRHPSGAVRWAFGLYKWVWSSRERSELHI